MEEKDKRKIETFTTMESGFEPEEKYNIVDISETESGAICFSRLRTGSESFVYLYPDQVEALKKFLSIPLVQSVCEICEEEKECKEFKGNGYKVWICQKCLDEE
jgi:hypothetical protein